MVQKSKNRTIKVVFRSFLFSKNALSLQKQNGEEALSKCFEADFVRFIGGKNNNVYE